MFDKSSNLSFELANNYDSIIFVASNSHYTLYLSILTAGKSILIPS